MKQTVNRYYFHRAFETVSYGRPYNFSVDALDALFDYLIEYYGEYIVENGQLVAVLDNTVVYAYL